MSRQPTITAPDWAGSDLTGDLTVLTGEMLAWYESGVVVGIGLGRAQAEDELQQAWSAMASKVRVLARARSMSYAALWARRGEPERAERGRRQTQRVMTS